MDKHPKMDMLKTTIIYQVSGSGEIKVKRIERESFRDDPYTLVEVDGVMHLKYELMYESYDKDGNLLDGDDLGERPMKEVYYDVFASSFQRQLFIDNSDESIPTLSYLEPPLL